VAWEHAYPGPCCDWDIKAQELDGLGGLVGGAVTLADSSDDETAPRVTTGPRYERKYLAVWQRSTGQGETVWARAWGDPGWQFFGEVASGTAWHHENPAVAAGGPSAFIAYEGDSGSNPLVYRHIYGRRWVPNAIFLPLVDRNW
jgi:hypothetical protein